MNSNSSIAEPPLGSYAYTIECCDCGADIHTHTMADLTDPSTREMVERLAKMTTCEACHAKRPVSNEAVIR